ncbi:DUF2970 domain-containing protein [Endozoicomonas sp. Mp262]|uniref:DUF2970 domain-containing protein n=1 Tax=Endozoicomonas sp. Mp262 TaxID=2919499 RepID=UPI0021DA654E
MNRKRMVDVIQSVLASAFGVQKSENYHRDVQEGRPSQYITAGIIATVIFVLSLIGIVELVLYFN